MHHDEPQAWTEDFYGFPVDLELTSASLDQLELLAGTGRFPHVRSPEATRSRRNVDFKSEVASPPGTCSGRAF